MIGQSGEQWFIQRIGIGLDADKVQRATREWKAGLLSRLAASGSGVVQSTVHAATGWPGRGV